MKTLANLNLGLGSLRALSALSLSALLFAACTAEPQGEDSNDNDNGDESANLDGENAGTSEEGVSSSSSFLEKTGKIRVASWNTFHGSVFPQGDKNDKNDVWHAINNAGTYDERRTEAAKRIFKTVKADVWLLQETAYWDPGEGGLPKPFTTSQINSRIESYMKNLTNDNTWDVRCNGLGLCIMVHGNIGITSTCMKEQRTNGYLVSLKSFNKASLMLANVHYIKGHIEEAKNTKNMIEGSHASAFFLGGDFNNGPNEPLVNKIQEISNIKELSAPQTVDSNAAHVSNAYGKPAKTHGHVVFAPKSQGSALAQAKSFDGGQIDHLFLRSHSGGWKGSAITLNTLVLSKGALGNLHPLDVAVLGHDDYDYFSDRFKSFPTIPAFSGSVTVDHLPMIADLDFTTAQTTSAGSLACP